MLSKLAVWYLRKRKKSVLMNFDIRFNTVKELSRDCYLYDNYLKNIVLVDADGEVLDLPKGKFKVSYSNK